MKKAESKQINAPVSAQTYEFLAKTWPSATQAGTWVLGSFPGLYHATMVEIRGKFTAGELKMLVDIGNGSALLLFSGNGLAGQRLPLSVADSFTIYPGQHEQKWGVDSAAMLKKINELTRFQLVALEIWAGSFWQGDYESETAIEDHVKILA